MMTYATVSQSVRGQKGCRVAAILALPCGAQFDQSKAMLDCRICKEGNVADSILALFSYLGVSGSSDSMATRLEV
jgi:hypothetical protein